jgi:hypothetical protein
MRAFREKENLAEHMWATLCAYLKRQMRPLLPQVTASVYVRQAKVWRPSLPKLLEVSGNMKLTTVQKFTYTGISTPLGERPIRRRIADELTPKGNRSSLSFLCDIDSRGESLQILMARFMLDRGHDDQRTDQSDKGCAKCGYCREEGGRH